MSNSIIKLPINDFYNPTPEEVTEFDKLIPDNKQNSYNELLLVSCVTSFLLILVFYLIIYMNKHTISTYSLIFTYIIVLVVLFVTSIMSENIIKLFSTLL